MAIDRTESCDICAGVHASLLCPRIPVDDEVRSVSATGGEKGTKLARFDLLPVGPLRQVAEHYGKGASKYADHNWRRGYEWSKSYAALQRHVTQFWGGEDIDEETGSHHMAAVAFHALALLEFAERFPDFDDRFRAPTPATDFSLYFPVDRHGRD